MKHPVDSSGNSVRLRRLLLMALGLAIVLGIADYSIKLNEEVDSVLPPVREVARFRMETRLGRLYQRETTSPFSGFVTDYSAEGRLKGRSGVASGRLHGLSESWWPDGKLEMREQFQDGIPHGVRTTWHTNGALRSEGRLVSGKQQGLYRQWSETGILLAQAEFADGQPHGLSRAWHPSGFVKAEALMEHGKVVTRQFYPDGVQRQPVLMASAKATRQH